MTSSINFNKVIEAVKSTKDIVFDDELLSIVNIKGEADFVTAVDTKISQYLKKKLSIITPNIDFMSEEEENEIKSIRWILDPIDGTTNLIYGYNISSVSLALCVNEIIEFGVVYNPFNDDIYTAYKGKGAFFNGKRMPKAPNREFKKCIIEFGAGSTNKSASKTSFEIAERVFNECLDLRRICSSALSICYIAQGRINGYFEKRIKPWDYAAASLILDECGGKMSDWNGNYIQFKNATSCIFATPNAYEKLYRIIKEVCDE